MMSDVVAEIQRRLDAFHSPSFDREIVEKLLGGYQAQETLLAEAREALEIDKAVYAAALIWCGEKERETFIEDIEYFKHNWRSLPGLTSYVVREFERRARVALSRLKPGEKGGDE